jgi:hypothetical protein
MTTDIKPGEEIFKISNAYHTLPKWKKIEMLEALISWSSDELDKAKLIIDSTSNADMQIGLNEIK